MSAIHRRSIMSLIVLVSCHAVLVAPAARASDSIVPTPGLSLKASARLRTGGYRLTDGGSGAIRISGEGFVVDCAGARLVGPGKGTGVGIHITDSRNVTIRNADLSGFRWGIVVERSIGVKLIDCHSSYNNDLKPGTVIDESGHEPEDQWGGGILLRDCAACSAQRCVAQYQWDGIDVIRSSRCTIEDGDFSYNGNWGVHLWDSSRNRFRRNRAIWCTTGGGKLYQALTGWQTYDSQAVGIDHNSNENLIEDNDLRFGGDGIFIRANEGPITPGTVVPPRNGSHRNVLRGNDCSFSPNNAIEVDLVDDTVIEDNNCSNSHYGMWLGYSRRCIVRGNTCVNDTAHAVEIENGQDDLFERNVFGYDDRRPTGQLVYLRQNGRDKTPSRGYRFGNNLFYGAGRGVLAAHTEVSLDHDVIVPIDDSTQLVSGDSASRAIERGTVRGTPDFAPRPQFVLPNRGPVTLKPGAAIAMSVPGASSSRPPPVIEIDGIPAWVRRIDSGRVIFWMPDDFWDRPAKPSAQIRAYTGVTFSEPVTGLIPWAPGRARITEIRPNPANLGEVVVANGANVTGGSLLLNGAAVRLNQAAASKMTFELPEGILTTTRFNVVWERGAGRASSRTWPITFAVDIPSARLPHLVSATFEPLSLKVGERLKVVMTLRNNLPIAALLTTKPAPPFTYAETQASSEMGITEQEGHLHLRVTSDNTAPHDSGSWPYLFGFDRPALAPGETITVTGYIRMEHPGEREFRVGLVAGGFRFIDDNAFRTRITVTK